MKHSILMVVFALALGCFGVAAAHAQTPGQGTASYHSAMRPTCEAEIKKDKDWYADLKEQIWAVVQKDASHAATTNNRHVVFAYAAFWLLTVGFVAFMWMRQRKLKDEIERLERELKKAEKEEENEKEDEKTEKADEKAEKPDDKDKKDGGSK